jgi:plastocyanin
LPYGGIAGAIGPAGADGVDGVDGIDGATGPEGPAGPAGETGATGATGPAGQDGTGISILGSLDDVGDLPATGDIGDAYLIDSDLYVWDSVGEDWVNAGSVQGPAGATGPAGPEGPAGADGAAGPTGPTGATGPEGPQGPEGPAGFTTFNEATDATLAGITIDEVAYSAVTRLQVTSSGTSAYLFNNQYSGNNPTLSAIAGTTIAFNLNVPGHPFLIRYQGANYNTGLIHVSTTGVVTTGADAQGKTSGTLYWQLPSNISGDYGYLCSVHGSMIGTIKVSTIVQAPESSNAIINGAFDIWQRGTSFTPTTGNFSADRWRFSSANAEPTSYTITRQAFDPGSEPISGLGSTFFLRAVLTTIGASTKLRIQQRIEGVESFANKTVTVSFYAKSDSNRTQTVSCEQLFGSGGSSTVNLSEQNINTTTSWQRFSLQFNVPSISGKTVGTGSAFQVTINQNLTNGNTLDIWGVQVESGSVATPFRRNAPSIQAELAACQRYYTRFSGVANGFLGGRGNAHSTTQAYINFALPTSMRIRPLSIDNSTLQLFDDVNLIPITSLAVSNGTEQTAVIIATVASGLTQFRSYSIVPGTTANFLGFSAEL